MSRYKIICSNEFPSFENKGEIERKEIIDYVRDFFIREKPSFDNMSICEIQETFDDTSKNELIYPNGFIAPDGLFIFTDYILFPLQLRDFIDDVCYYYNVSRIGGECYREALIRNNFIHYNKRNICCNVGITEAQYKTLYKLLRSLDYSSRETKEDIEWHIAVMDRENGEVKVSKFFKSSDFTDVDSLIRLINKR